MDGCLKRSPVTVNPLFINLHERRISLEGGWGFRLDPEDIGVSERWFDDIGIMWEKINVPGTWQGQGFGGVDKDEIWDFRLKARTFRATYKGTGWYGKRFSMPEEYKGKRIWLNFGGVHPGCEIWLNGIKIGEHSTPFVPFGFDVTGLVRHDGENTLAVRVNEQGRILGYAFNHQGNWSGLYRNVELTATGDSYFEKFWMTPLVKEEKIGFRVEIGDFSGKMDIDISVYTKGSDVPAVTTRVSTDQSYFEFDLNISSPELWSPDSPNLYRVDALLYDKEGRIADALSERTGFVELTTSGKHILINREPYYMRGSGDFIANPETGCPDTDRERWRKKLKTLREYGYNYVRCQTYVPTPEYFDAADEVGLLVQSEMGMIGPWGGLQDIYHVFQWPLPMPEYKGAMKWQWDHVVMRDINHPSANIYCMSNEWGYMKKNPILFPRITWECYNDTKKIKPTAFVIWSAGGNDETMPGEFVNCDAVDDINCELPVIQHEYRWWSSFPDIRTMHKFNGALRPYGAEIALEAATHHGISKLLPTFAENSQRLQFIEAKGKMELCRRDNPTLAGITHFNACDLNLSPQGIIDEFYERKYADSATWCQTNGDTVVMTSLNFDDRVFYPGDLLKCSFTVSDFSHPSLENPEFSWNMTAGGKLLSEGKIEYGHVPYCTCGIGSIEVRIPEVTAPQMVKLEAVLVEKGRRFGNCWSLWVFPRTASLPGSVYIYGERHFTWLKDIKNAGPAGWSADNMETAALVLTEYIDEKLSAYVKNGGRVVLAATEGLVRPYCPRVNAGRYYFTPPANWSPYDDGLNGTVINDSPMLGDIPHEGFADLQFYRLIAESPPMDLEWTGLNKGNTVIRAIHAYPICRPLAFLTECAFGKGGLIACSMNLNQAWPEARYLLSEICRYAAGEAFKPLGVLDAKDMERIVSATGLTQNVPL